jgi:hypothetical protein
MDAAGCSQLHPKAFEARLLRANVFIDAANELPFDRQSGNGYKKISMRIDRDEQVLRGVGIS